MCTLCSPIHEPVIEINLSCFQVSVSLLAKRDLVAILQGCCTTSIAQIVGQIDPFTFIPNVPAKVITILDVRWQKSSSKL